MTDFSDHVKMLAVPFIAALFVFVFAYTFHFEDLWRAAFVSCAMIIGVILILARFGGAPPGTG